MEYLEVSAADACMIQESRTLGDASRAAERGAKRAKWDMAVNDVVATDAGSTSAGVAIAARCHVGLGADDAVQPPGEYASRVAVRWLGGYARGGLHLVSVYFWHTEQLSARNLDLMQVVAGIVRGLDGPWIIAVDFNMPPDVVRGSGWLALLGGEIAASGQPTCKGHEIDYAVAPRVLMPEVVAVVPVVVAG